MKTALKTAFFLILGIFVIWSFQITADLPKILRITQAFVYLGFIGLIAFNFSNSKRIKG